jgi:NADH dehydrogenase [ubiquinone] 1 alpha subcomplex assembly factor 7
MTPLLALLIRRIKATGPITLADYMSECLLHPRHGYYTTREPFGTKGDFTTAPEISQMFGELLGLCLAQTWLNQGAPTAFTLAELGPGRGTLMADLLRATRTVAGFHAAARVTLIEASPRLRALQRTTLGAHSAEWHDTIEALPDAPLYLIANEFFDALPIRQFTRTPQGWAETIVGVSNESLTLGLSSPAPLAALNHRLHDTTPGDIVEICTTGPHIATAIAGRIAQKGGVALILDYGGWRSRGDTFQALHAHAPAHPLASPGTADLTAHVDFEALAGPHPHAFTTQGRLLEALGINARSARLAASLSGEALQSHLSATRRLTAPQEMGELFKALAIFPPHFPPPPGFT